MNGAIQTANSGDGNAEIQPIFHAEQSRLVSSITKYLDQFGMPKFTFNISRQEALVLSDYVLFIS